MGKFKFSVQIPAKAANPAKKHEQQGIPSVKPLLKFAKMQTESMDTPSSLANFSKPLASQDTTTPTVLAGLAGLATPGGDTQAPQSPDLSEIQPKDFMTWQERSRLKKVPGLPNDLIQAPAVWRPGPIRNRADQGDHPDTCPACGQSQWWCLDKPNSKWICGRCHPPAAGLAVVWMER